MAEKRDYYEILGVNKQAGNDELKKAYRKLSKQYHPDVNPGDKTAEEKFKEINEAYSILSDAEKRKTYDQFGHQAFTGGGGGGGFHGGMDIGDIFSQVFGSGGMDSIFGSSRQRRGPRRGADLETRLNISFEEAVFGAKRDIQIQTQEICDTCKGNGAKPGTFPETCKTCNGTGQQRVTSQTMFGQMTQVVTCQTCRGEGKIIRERCPKCKGQKRIRTTKTLEITIPKGIDNNQSLRLEGKGEQGEVGAGAGDLYIIISVSGHRLFTREGMNLYLEIPITFVQAALGDEIIIPTLSGQEEKYTIKPGTQPGSIVNLKGKGVPSLRNNRNVGDLVVKLNVTIPTQLDDRQREILKSFNEAMGEDYKNHKKRWFDKVKSYFK